MAVIGKWLVGAVLGWLATYVRGLIEAYNLRKKKEEERKVENEDAVKKLEEAEGEQETIDAGGNLLER